MGNYCRIPREYFIEHYSREYHNSTEILTLIEKKEQILEYNYTSRIESMSPTLE